MRHPLLLISLAFLTAPALAQQVQVERDTRPPIAPDIREDESRLKVQRGDFVAVPIPISSPTFGTGLIAGAAYFYPQSEEQAALQPASLTAVAGAYTDNDSRALAVVQQNYWARNRWRFTGALGAADLRLSLRTPDEDTGTTRSDWRINGEFLFARLSGRFRDLGNPLRTQPARGRRGRAQRATAPAAGGRLEFPDISRRSLRRAWRLCRIRHAGHADQCVQGPLLQGGRHLQR